MTRNETRDAGLRHLFRTRAGWEGMITLSVLLRQLEYPGFSTDPVLRKAQAWSSLHRLMVEGTVERRKFQPKGYGWCYQYRRVR